jgi:hypothetical protein
MAHSGQDYGHYTDNTMSTQVDTVRDMPYTDHTKLVEGVVRQIEARSTFLLRRLNPKLKEPSDRQIAALIGVRHGTWANWIAGDQPSIKRLCTVADRLGCQVWELLHPNPEELHRDLSALARYRKAEKDH